MMKPTKSENKIVIDADLYNEESIILSENYDILFTPSEKRLDPIILKRMSDDKQLCYESKIEKININYRHNEKYNIDFVIGAWSGPICVEVYLNIYENLCRIHIKYKENTDYIYEGDASSNIELVKTICKYLNEYICDNVSSIISIIVILSKHNIF